MFGPFIVGYILTGLAAENYQPDLATDAAAIYLRTHQAQDGSWPYPEGDNRPPLCWFISARLFYPCARFSSTLPKSEKRSGTGPFSGPLRGLPR